MAQVRVVESGIDKRNDLGAGQDGKTKDSAKKANGNTNEKGVKGGAFVESADNRNSSAAAVQGSVNGIADAYTKNGESVDDSTKDDKGEKAAPNVNSDDAVQGSRNGKVEIVKNNNVDTLEGSDDGKTKEASNGENDDTEDGRTEQGINGNGGYNADDVNGCEAKESNSHGNDECAERPEEGKAQEPNNNENSANVVICCDKDGKEKEGDTNTEQSPIDAGGDSKAEDAEHSTSTKVDVDSGKNGTAEDGKPDGDVKANSNGIAEGNQM
uniref:Uncharacterized protein n=1 Tax=Arundo donax TaxID=35708 RepID=A0A0A9EY69_ARUDO